VVHIRDILGTYQGHIRGTMIQRPPSCGGSRFSLGFSLGRGSVGSRFSVGFSLGPCAVGFSLGPCAVGFSLGPCAVGFSLGPCSVGSRFSLGFSLGGSGFSSMGLAQWV